MMSSSTGTPKLECEEERQETIVAIRRGLKDADVGRTAGTFEAFIALRKMHKMPPLLGLKFSGITEEKAARGAFLWDFRLRISPVFHGNSTVK